MKNHLTLAMAWLAINLLFLLNVSAQSLSFDKVLTVQLRNSGTITQGSEVKGYYYFYTEDKVDRKTNEYRIRIVDANLKEVTNELITAASTLYLSEGIFNGENLMLKFIDFKNEKIEFRIYDSNGKFFKRIETLSSKKELQTYQTSMVLGEFLEGTLFSVPGVGFLSIKPDKEKKMGYEIKLFDKDRGFAGWTYESNNTSGYEAADFVACDGNTLIVQVLRAKGFMYKDFDTYLIGIDIKSGKKKFENKLFKSPYNLQMVNGIVDEEGNFFLFGQFTEQGDNAMKDNSLGFCGMKLDTTGKAIFTKLVFWDKDVSNFLPVNEKGKIKDVGYVFFHQIVKTADGRVFAIGEQYKKAVSGLGVAANLLYGGNSGVSNFKVVVADMMIFEFSPDFNLEGVSVFEKGKSNVSLPAGYGVNNAQTLATMLKLFGAFDYSYTQIPNDRSKFTVCLQDWEKEKGEKGRMTFKSITQNGDEYVTDKIDMITEASLLRVLPAKQGYVLITEYFRKGKRMDMRLEKFNQ